MNELDSPLLSKRVKNLLKELEIKTIDQLAFLSYRVFLNRYGMGKGSLDNVIAFLALHGKKLREMPPTKDDNV